MIKVPLKNFYLKCNLLLNADIDLEMLEIYNRILNLPNDNRTLYGRFKSPQRISYLFGYRQKKEYFLHPLICWVILPLLTQPILSMNKKENH